MVSPKAFVRALMVVLPLNRNVAGFPTLIARDKFSLMESILKCWTLSCAQKKGILTMQKM